MYVNDFPNVTYIYGWTDIRSGYPNSAGFLLFGQIRIRSDFTSYAGSDIFDLRAPVSSVVKELDN